MAYSVQVEEGVRRGAYRGEGGIKFRNICVHNTCTAPYSKVLDNMLVLSEVYVRLRNTQKGTRNNDDVTTTILGYYRITASADKSNTDNYFEIFE